MVVAIPTSDSASTLVSLDQHEDCGQRIIQETGLHQQLPTNLLLPNDQYLYLPARSCPSSLDEYLLKNLPPNTREDIFDRSTYHFTASSQERVLYVHQGEMAHATSNQSDILMSDKATTCHILILRSTSTVSSNMTSLTHIDGTHEGYAWSLREMVQAHKRHHRSGKLQMAIHILGGFATDISRKLSHWLMRLLADIADDEPTCTILLETCALSSGNDKGCGMPRGRGMGVNLHTGKVFLAQAQANATIPVLPLRNARIWANHGPRRQLYLIHSTHSQQLTLHPFRYKSRDLYTVLLECSDRELLQRTSTSPQAESTQEFVPMVRQTLQFLLQTSCQGVFGVDLDTPLKMERCPGTFNHWCLV